MKLYKGNARDFKQKMDSYRKYIESKIDEGDTFDVFIESIIESSHRNSFENNNQESIGLVAALASFFKICKERDFKDPIFNKANFGKMFKSMNSGLMGGSFGVGVSLVDVDILSQYDGEEETFEKIEKILPVQPTEKINYDLAKENGIQIEQYRNAENDFDFGVDLKDLAKENAQNKINETKKTLDTQYATELNSGSKTAIFFNNDFLTNCFKNIQRPSQLSKEQYKNLSSRVKESLDYASNTLSQNDSKEVINNVCLTRLQSYFQLKDKVQKRTLADIIFHPIKSYRESKLLKETKNMLNNEYKFSDTLLNSVERICIKEKEFPKNIYCLNLDGTIVPDKVPQENIDIEYEKLKQDPKYKEYVYDDKAKGLKNKLRQEFNKGNDVSYDDLEDENGLMRMKQDPNKSIDSIERD